MGHRRSDVSFQIPPAEVLVVAAFWLDCLIDGGTGHAEKVSQISRCVLAGLQLRNQMRFLTMVLGCLPRRWSLALATFISSRVRNRMRSDSNSATIAMTLKSSRPTGSLGL